MGVDEKKRYWQMERLSLIKQHLPEDWRKRYDDFLTEFDEPNEDLGRGFTFRGGACGNTSPISKGELLAMADEEILSALQTTEFSGKWDEPSADGLADVLQECAKEKPERFADIAQSFKGIQDDYIGALIRGLKAARTEGKDFSLGNLLSLFDALTASDSLTAMAKDEEASEWLKQEMAHFVSVILDGNITLPGELSEKIWRILSRLFKSTPPDSVIASMDNKQIDISDAVMNAGRTARGDAARAVMSFMHWRARNLGWDKIETAKHHSMKHIPEIAKLLEEYLSGAPCADIHPTVGANLQMLLWIDEPWVIHHLPLIFPGDSSHKSFRDLAWCGYLNRQSVMIEAVRAFEHQYRRAIEEIRVVEDDADYPDRDQTCASHVINYYLSGNIMIGDSTSLLARLLERAPSRLMRRVFEDFRRALDEHETSPEILERFRLFIEYRLTALVKLDSESGFPEITGLAALICSKGFPSDWVAAKLLIALTKIDGRIESDYWVVERMKELAEVGYISEVLQGFILLTKGAKNDWEIQSWEEELDAVFKLSTSSGKPTILASAKQLADKLGDRGFDGYRKRWFNNN